MADSACVVCWKKHKENNKDNLEAWLNKINHVSTEHHNLPYLPSGLEEYRGVKKSHNEQGAYRKRTMLELRYVMEPSPLIVLGVINMIKSLESCIKFLHYYFKGGELLHEYRRGNREESRE